MARVPLISVVILLAAAWIAADQAPARPAPAAPMLTVDSIMRGPKLVGTAPTDVRWSADSAKIYFTWQPAVEPRAATWTANRDGGGLRKLSVAEARSIKDALPNGQWDRARKRLVTAEEGDIVIVDAATGERRAITRTAASESSPHWARNDTAVAFVRDGNLFLTALDGSGPAIAQLTDIATPAASDAATGRGGRGGQSAAGETASQRILREEQLALIDHLKREQAEREAVKAQEPPVAESRKIAQFSLSARQRVTSLRLSGDETFVWIGLEEQPEPSARNQDVPNYVTESAYPEMISGRPNVGDARPQRRLALLNLKSGAVVWPDSADVPGSEPGAAPGGSTAPRLVDWSMPDISADGSHAVVAVRAHDNKDRWLVTVDATTGKATSLDRLHDDAWVRELQMSGSGSDEDPGIVWLPDHRRFLFLSEKTGWMHLYLADAAAPGSPPRALTSGTWEVTDAKLSNDRQTVLLATTEVHPGERQLYTMPAEGGARTRVSTLTGAHSATPSPDGQTLAVVYSYANKPPELSLMPFRAGAAMTQVTTSPTDEWRAFKWIDPKVITYQARDGAQVYARLFTPEMIGAKRDPKRPGVVFVHGAGYLQEAHRYWSTSYYRENMFSNLLASRGYVVIAPDYRASSGYGRDWRTAIYRHMGGKDLEDVVDAANVLVRTERVDPKRLGVYGGSYGGFITLMALFTTPDVFAAGAALRPVTDWTHYNHEYTSNILNVPQNDLEAFRRSSPIYFAEGLKGRLLILHGMVDTNVFFQDSMRLVQRLIELRKENWSVEPYPVENHAFTEETSWADEYRRILAMFEDTIRR